MLFNRKLEKPYVAAVIPAAGSARRMNGLDKLFEELAGVPVLVRSMLALAQSDWIDELVIVTRQEDIPDVHALVRAWGVPKVRTVISGGQTRQQSVQNGVAAVSAHAQYIAVHDGARPMVSQQVIADAVIDGIRYGAATAAVPVADTIKVADENRKICATPDRASLYAVQTPQVFELELYRRAALEATASALEYTDDCQMIEAVGKPVYLSNGDYDNLKITTPIDLLVAQAMAELAEELK